MKSHTLMVAGTSVLVLGGVSHAEIKTVADHNGNPTASFKFKNVPAPSRSDAAAKARFTIVDGAKDNNGGDVDKLNDGKVPTDDDQPAENFFFQAGTDGGHLLVDLGGAIEIKQVNTYSWHPTTRGPQVYQLYASDGRGDFNAQPKKGTEPVTSGWRLIAEVDTRSPAGESGGQYGVSISDSDGTIGAYRYLLFDIFRTEASDNFGNTFYSEIDVIDRNAPEVVEAVVAQTIQKTFTADGGKHEITIDTSEASDLTDWAGEELAPVVREWYPKIVRMLPSEGYEAPNRVTIAFREGMNVPAAANGSRISCNSGWFRRNLKGEARGAVVHEMVHVVQQYGRARRNNPDATRMPGWLVEGIADYIRWFLYEPETKGAEITQRNISRARYDGNYRITGNFLNWVTEKYARDIVEKLNAAAREGRYHEILWKQSTGKTVEELGDEWKASHEKRLAAASTASRDEPKTNTLTDGENQEGWKLLFNGRDLDGWHNFRTNTVRPGWQVKDGTLACVDPHDAGDLCTEDQYDWFELQLDYNFSEGGNSGVMYHVTDQGRSAWATGPEVQLEDNAKAADPQRCGWLYALYQPPIDPKTEKPLDATKPAGEWNRVRLLITPEKCEHEINGVKYFDYVLGSEDFNQRVARSKFSRMPLFAKSNIGYLVLQGDHGQVSFRNIKIRPIAPKK
jgi:hypothetical protein